MLHHRAKKYEKHNHIMLGDIKKEIAIDNKTREMKNRFNHIEKFVSILDSYSFQEIPSFYKDFKDIGVKKKAFSNYIKFFNEDFKNKDITTRIQQKSNSCDLNIILTALCLLDPVLMRKKFEDLISYLRPNKKIEDFKQKISDKIQLISTMKMNKDYSNNTENLTNGIENCSNDFNLFDDINDVNQIFEEMDNEKDVWF